MDNQNVERRRGRPSIEFKTPLCTGVLSETHKTLLEQCEQNGYKTLVSNDYDYLIKEINDYLKDVRIRCKYYDGKFISIKSLEIHNKYFHWIHTMDH